MRILSVGSLSGMSNTCLHRNWALHKVADEVDEINTQLNLLHYGDAYAIIFSF